MYHLLKNLNAPDFLNAAAAACGILQLSANSISDLRHRIICPKITLICGIAGLGLALSSFACSSGAFSCRSTGQFFIDILQKAACLLLLTAACRISRGGIGIGDLICLASLACCCSFRTWITTIGIGFSGAFFLVLILFFLNIFHRCGRSVRSLGIPFIPLLLTGFLLALFTV